MVRDADTMAKTLSDPAFLNTRAAAAIVANRGKTALAATAKRLYNLIELQDG